MLLYCLLMPSRHRLETAIPADIQGRPMARNPYLPVRPASLLEVRDSSQERRRLSLRQIEVFRAVMISGSINGASQMLRVSQPSLSRVVRRTEDVLGFNLFERIRGRLVPTKEAGSLLVLV